jgi:hypothetical protein
LAFSRLVEAEASLAQWDERDAMIDLAPVVDCARRLGLDPEKTLSPIAETGPGWYRDLFAVFVKRQDWSLASFGWQLLDSSAGPVYRFAWPLRRDPELAG